MSIVLIHQFPEGYHGNSGVISRIGIPEVENPNDPFDVLVEIKHDDGFGLTHLPASSCINFDPKLGDRVEIFVAENGEIDGWLIVKTEK